ncbi:MAG: PorT family protein [Prevotella sp.]|nr:PorT family protein [Prevotella sp.]
MKKVFLAIVAVVLSASSAMAQSPAGSVYVKPMVGGTLTTLTKNDNSKMKLGLVGGAEVGYQVSDAFAVTGGVLASMQGAKMKDYSEVVAGETYSVKDASTSLTYLNIPILANYYIVPGLSIKAGIQPGFLLSHKSKATEVTPAGEFKEEETSTSGLKKFDFSIPLGLSYEISDFVIDARYNLGLTKVSKAADSKNSVIMLTVGYKIPL